MCQTAEADPQFSSVAMESASDDDASSVTISCSALHCGHHARLRQPPEWSESWLEFES